MQNLWQKKLKLNYSKEVIDIIQFGSSIIDGKKANDVDIAIFFQKIPLKEQLEEAQKIKKQLQIHTELPIHVNSYDFCSFFDEGNFAKESILFYGKSLINEKYLAERLGFIPMIQINYSLIKLEKKDKIRFNYLLNGRGGNYGLLRQYGGKLLNPGLIEIFPEHEEIFVSALKKITLNIRISKIFKLGL